MRPLREAEVEGESLHLVQGKDIFDCLELVGLELLPGRCLDKKDLFVTWVAGRGVVITCNSFKLRKLQRALPSASLILIN